MSWWQLLGEAWLFRMQHPALARRVADLIAEIETANIDPSEWPYPRETVLAGPFQMRAMVIKATEGYDALITALEKRWASDARNPHRRKRRPGPNPNAILSTAEAEETRAKLKAEGKPYGYQAIAAATGASVSTVRRRLKAL